MVDENDPRLLELLAQAQEGGGVELGDVHEVSSNPVKTQRNTDDFLTGICTNCGFLL